MSHTQRSKKSGEVLRSAKPYKREQRPSILKEFEQSYIASNQDPDIHL